MARGSLEWLHTIIRASHLEKFVWRKRTMAGNDGLDLEAVPIVPSTHGDAVEGASMGTNGTTAGTDGLALEAVPIVPSTHGVDVEETSMETHSENYVGNDGADFQDSNTLMFEPMQGANLMPLTVKQINDAISSAQSGQPIINWAVPRIVKVLGRLLEPTQRDGKWTFKIYDGTGVINAIYWECIDDIPADTPACARDGDYVTVHGRLARHGGASQLTALNVRKVTDYNNVTLHMIEAMLCHAEIRKMKDEQRVRAENSARSSIREAVLQFIKNNTKPDGFESVRISDMVVALRVPYEDLSTVIGGLVSTGDIYNTVDEHSFRAT